jgi:hypothetical protein
VDVAAVALAAAGRHAEARQVLAGAAPLRPDFYHAVFATLRAVAVVALGLREHAEALTETLAPLRGQLAGAASTSLVMRPVAHTMGELAGLLGRRAEAAEGFAEAVTVARAWEAPHWEAEAATALAAARA